MNLQQKIDGWNYNKQHRISNKVQQRQISILLYLCSDKK